MTEEKSWLILMFSYLGFRSAPSSASGMRCHRCHDQGYRQQEAYLESWLCNIKMRSVSAHRKYETSRSQVSWYSAFNNTIFARSHQELG
jgi:hypothetical protein